MRQRVSYASGVALTCSGNSRARVARDTPSMASYSASKAADLVAKGILDGVTAGLEDIYPDPSSEQKSGMWARNPKTFELALRGE